jgi:WD40 repeat protein/tRNA A-37 threonylcarbamoyl transferase component Bud32
MAADRTCTRCGAQRSGASLEGLCPRCMLASALEEPPPTGRSEFELQSTGVSSSTGESSIATFGLKLRYFGDYELIEEIGRGGMGIVYRARQVSLNRLVAVKVLLHGEFSDPAFVGRFRTEAEAAAQLNHPNIVPVYEVGEHQGQHYFSMRLIEGCTLADLIARSNRAVLEIVIPPASRQDQATIAGLVAKVARAVHFAHQHGVLHRDIKPHNILLDDLGEPHLTDFGLAKLLEQDSGLTHSLSVLGSPSFMAPEQAAGQARHLTTAADVYSLGAVLYALLTGSAPFQGSSPIDILRQVCEAEPARPTVLNSDVDRDLETICLKCLEKDPARRYGSAEDLADDLQRWLHHVPILARPVSLLAYTNKWVQRKPLVAGLAAAVAVLLVIVTIGSLIAVRRATTNAWLLRKNLYVAETKVAQQALRDANLIYARTLLDKQQPKSGEEDFRGFEWRYLWGLAHGELFAFQQGQTGVVNTVAFSPDGQLLASGGQDRSVKIWRVATRTLVATLEPHSGAVSSVAFSPDGRTLAAGVEDWKAQSEAVKLWDLQSRSAATLRLPGPGGSTRTVAFSPDGQIIALGSADSDVRLWNPKTGEVISLHGHDGSIASVAFSPDGKKLASASDDKTARLWDLKSMQTTAILTNHEDVLWCVAFSHDGSMVVTTSRDCTAALWSAAAGRLISRSHRGSTDVPKCKAAFSRDDSMIAVAEVHGLIQLFQHGSWGDPRMLLGHTDGAWDLTFSPTEDLLASASVDGSVRLWNTKLRANPEVLEFQGATISCVQFSPQGGKTLALGFDSGTVQFRDVATETNSFEIEGEGGPWPNPFLNPFRFAFLAFSPDGKRLALARSTNTVQIWDLTTRRVTNVITVPEEEGVFCIAYSPDGRRIATGSKSKTATLWEIATGRRLHTLPVDEGRVESLAFSGDGTLLATGSDPGMVKLWKVASGRMFAQHQGHKPYHGMDGAVLALAFSPDNSILASTGFDRRLILWDITSGRQRVLTAHQAVTGCVSFSKDGKTIATSDFQNVARLWNVTTGQEIADFRGRVIAFSPDDKGLAIAEGMLRAITDPRASSRVSLYRAPLLEEIMTREASASGHHDR